jgi:hypothetical protein
VHLPHLLSGYLADVTTQSVLDDQSRPDWLLHYTPGPKARAEFQAFTTQHRKGRSSLPVAAGTEEPEATVSEGSRGEPVDAASVILPLTAGTTGTMSPPGDPEPTSSAAELVQYFYRVFHRIEDCTPTSKALSQAESLIAQRGVEQAMYLIDFSRQEAAKTNYKPETLGGILLYQPRAFAAFDTAKTRQQQHQATQSCSVCDPNGWVVFERLDSGVSFSARCPHDENAIRRYEATRDCQRI